jgi:threonine/homoserine/homoserine lactone efflux protein
VVSPWLLRGLAGFGAAVMAWTAWCWARVVADRRTAARWKQANQAAARARALVAHDARPPRWDERMR